jgi:MYXO-CTERM domain-containing protein
MVPGFILVAAALTANGPTLQLPWTCGGTERCSQAHNGGSHTGASRWAWDFVLQDGEEIWAASAGVVTHVKKDSTVSGCNSAYIADANFVTIDHGDGTSIIYAHMRTGSIPLEVGDEVEVGDLVGKVGQTGYSCGAHLHMAVMDQCGASHCQSVSASFADVGDPSAGEMLESGNCPVCPRVLDGGTTIIDDRDAGCLTRQTTSWWSSMEGHDRHHFYTYATDEEEPVSSGTWHLSVTVAGDYLVEAFIPENEATTQSALYQILHAEGMAEVVVDQANDKGWQPLGTFRFTDEAEQMVLLGDATGESLDDERTIAYDALRFTFVPSEGGIDEPDETTGGDVATTGDVDDGDPDPDPVSETGGPTPEPPTVEPGLPSTYGDVDTSGCSCRSAPAPGVLVLLLGVFAGWSRRRRRPATAVVDATSTAHGLVGHAARDR